MTGFARSESAGEWGTLAWEVRSVNHRYLEMYFRLPEEARPLEGKLREAVARQVSRGKLECTLRIDKSRRGGRPFTINESLLSHLIEQCGEVSRRLDTPAPVGPVELLRWPGVTEEVESDPASLHAAAQSLLDEALASLNRARRREGERITEMIAQRCTSLAALVEEVQGHLPQVRERLRQRVLERLAKVDVQVDEARFEQELVLLLQKMDVDEELDRLGSHIAEARSVIERDEPVGRRLDFLMQEFNREANTLASKSQDTATTRAAVEMKVLIEQMREQVQNVE